MNKIIYITVFSSALLASGGSGETDILQRSVNFAIFLVLLYKIAYKPVKALLVNRTKEIQDKLEVLDTEIEKSKEARERAIVAVEDAKVRAKDVKKLIASEAKNIAQRIENETSFELQSLEKSYEAKKEIESKRLTTSLVKEITSEVFADESIVPTNEEISDIIIKKVG